MNIISKSIRLVVMLSITFMVLACKSELSNLIYEPITSTSFSENDTLYAFQYIVSNKYLKHKKSSMFKNNKNNLMKNYHWFENGKLFTSQGNYSGKLLHGNYIEKFKSGQMKAKGSLIYGLKDKIWISYFESGIIASIERWDNGILKAQKVYNDKYQITTDFTFRNFRKNGWEYTYDSIMVVSRVKYRNGEVKAYRQLNEL